jgi:hypothetical protein
MIMLDRYIRGQILGKINSDFSKGWTDQKLLKANQKVFGLYRYVFSKTQIGTSNLLFINPNGEYIILNYVGIGFSWSIWKKGAYIFENNTVEFHSKSRYSDFFKNYMNGDTLKLEENRLNPTSPECETYFQKFEYPKILQCHATEQGENKYNHNLTAGNFYVIDSEKDRFLIVYNDLGRLRKYPKELFETLTSLESL